MTGPRDGGHDGRYDVAVIGGGVVGCAVARRLTLAGADVILLEQAADILSGASKGNSALLHTGFDAPPGSLEHGCVRAGYAEYMEISDRLGLPLLETGAMVVAWTSEEAARLDRIVDQAHLNGIANVRRLSAAEVLTREPHLSQRVLGGVVVPDEHVIDPWSAPLAYLSQAVANGATVRTRTPVTAAAFDGREWTLQAPAGPVRAAAVVSCAGLFGDRVVALLLGHSPYGIRPRKGQFVVFDKAAARHLRTIVLPVPTDRTKGIVVTPTIFGNVLVGPTAEEQDDRRRATVDRPTLAHLQARAAEIVPALAGCPVTATYAGLRPATEHKDYQISVHPDRRLIDVGGIRSTGLTAALGIARHVLSLYQSFAGTHRAPADPVWPRVPNLAHHLPRAWQRPDAGEIVCHCELVTRGEIEAALTGPVPVPAGDLGGLKRRTRAMLGRCQGFYCSARLAELTHGRLAHDLAVATRGQAAGPAAAGPDAEASHG